MGQHTGKSDIFFMISTNLAKTGVGGASCCILYQNFTSKFVENLNINYRQLRLYCTGTFSAWTIMYGITGIKMYGINLY